MEARRGGWRERLRDTAMCAWKERCRRLRRGGAAAGQADNGAQVVQIFDSWASELAPQDFDVFAGPYIKQIIKSVRETHPDLNIILYISNSGGLMERMAGCQPDIVSVDQRVDMRDAIQRIGPSFAVQVPASPRICLPLQTHTHTHIHIRTHVRINTHRLSLAFVRCKPR